MKINEMKYGAEAGLKLSESKILFKSTYKGVMYVIINYGGSHPCAYIEVTGTKLDECVEFNKLKERARSRYWFKTSRKKRRLAESIVDCHGGVTFSSWLCPMVHEPKIMDVQDRWFVGWDYGHYGDFVTGLAPHSGKRWTTREMIADCKRAIESISSTK